MSKKPEPMTKQLHITLQSKGGAGKSYTTSIVAQYLKSKGKTLQCVDIDPKTPSFTKMKALDVSHIQILDEDDRLDIGNFDALTHRLSVETDDFVVDSGATSFSAIASYMTEIDLRALLAEHQRKVITHIPFISGDSLDDQFSTFASLAAISDDNSIVIWLNEFLGPIFVEGKDEAGEKLQKNFLESKVFDTYKHKVLGVVRIAKRFPDTFGKDLKAMLDGSLTFNEAIASPKFMLASKQRLKIVQRELYEQLDAFNF